MHKQASQTDRWLVRALLVSLVLFTNPWATLSYATVLHDNTTLAVLAPHCHADESAMRMNHTDNATAATSDMTNCNGCDSLGACDICTMGCCTSYSAGFVASFPRTAPATPAKTWLDTRAPSLTQATPSSPFHPPRA